MSYRIQVDPEAAQVLRTLRAHVVQLLGHRLAELAELISTAQPTPAREDNITLLEVEDYVLSYEVDCAEHTLKVRSVQPRAPANLAAPA